MGRQIDVYKLKTTLRDLYLRHAMQEMAPVDVDILREASEFMLLHEECEEEKDEPERVSKLEDEVDELHVNVDDLEEKLEEERAKTKNLKAKIVKLKAKSTPAAKAKKAKRAK